MTKAVIIQQQGGIEVLKLTNIKDTQPSVGEVLIKQTAIGINYFDVNYRKGDYALASFPAVLGLEACGYIEAVGPDVADFKVGDRVAYATGPLGSYAERRVIHADFLVSPPSSLTDEQIAASLVKGLTAHYLLFRTFLVEKVPRILVHSAAGGVGQFLCQWAKHLGVEVIGTVGSSEKIAAAEANGCHRVIDRSRNNFFERVRVYTKDTGFPVVFDGIGKNTLLDSVKSLGPLGLCANFGDASGIATDFNIDYLTGNSLFLTRPRLFMYKANRMELVLSANEVFNHLEKGVLRPKITTYGGLESIAKAQQDLESGKTIGSLVIKL